MSADLSPADKGLLEAVSSVDVMDTAGRIIASPRRAMVSLADQLAMALAIEQLQAIAIEAELLVRALALPENGDEAAMAVKDHAVQAQIDRVTAAIDGARGETNTDRQEMDDGRDIG